MAYLHVISEEGACHTGFVLGKAKLAPQAAHTIPRLELGAAVLAAELAETIMDELDFSLDAVEFYTDSRVVLGYINNQTRLFLCIRCQQSAAYQEGVKPNTVALYLYEAEPCRPRHSFCASRSVEHPPLGLQDLLSCYKQSKVHHRRKRGLISSSQTQTQRFVLCHHSIH